MMAAMRRRAQSVIGLACCLVAGLGGCSAGVGSTVSSAPADPWAAWHRALADQATGPATWVAYGDSITEGQGASSRERRWIDLTAQNLRSQSGSPAGAGYLPGWYAVYEPDSGWKPYRARSGPVTEEKFGSLGLRTAVLPEGSRQTYQVEGTSVDIYYATNGGVFQVIVDGVAASAVDSSGVYASANRTRIPFARGGSHSVAVEATQGTAYLAGVTVFDSDENAGIVLYDNAHSGFTAGDVVGAASDLNPLMGLISPDLVTVELGVNDYLSGSASPAQLATELQLLIDGLRAELADDPPSFVLVIPYRIGLAPDHPGQTWDAYAAALRSVAVSLGLGVCDMSSMGSSRPGGWWTSDGLHPSDAGHRRMAELATACLDGR